MPLRYDKAVLLGSAMALVLFVTAGAVLYQVAPSEAALKTELIKSLFDKVVFGGVVATFALIIGWFIEDAKARRSFVMTAQLTAATEMLSRASALATAAANWLYYEAPDMPAAQPYGVVFEQATVTFGRSWGTKGTLLPPHFNKVLEHFADLLMDPYYLYRDRKPNPLQELGTSNLDAVEFIGALEQSLYLEFLAAVGAPRERPQINLSATRVPRETFRDALARWDEERNRNAASGSDP